MSTAPPPDLDATRAAMTNEQVAVAAGHLTDDLYHVVPYQSLAALKQLLKRFFSRQPWTPADEGKLGELLMLHLDEAAGWWEHHLEGGVRLAHGFRDDRYHLWVGGGGEPAPSIFDRVFSGPVIPEATPNPRHVRFPVGGTPAPGRWYLAGDDAEDVRIRQLLADPDVADVLVGGDFVAVGLRRASDWPRRLDDILATVAELFHDPAAGPAPPPPERTRDQLVAEGEALHLLDPDRPESRARLEAATSDPDPRRRRMAVATLAHSGDDDVARRSLATGYDDLSRLVRRAAIDAAVDRQDEALRPLLQSALADPDPWIRWKAVKGIRELGVASSRELLEPLIGDGDFQVRFEVEAALRLDPSG